MSDFWSLDCFLGQGIVANDQVIIGVAITTDLDDKFALSMNRMAPPSRFDENFIFVW